MIGLVVFIAVYFLSILACNKLDELSGLEKDGLINYIPFINTFLLALAFVGGVLWWLVEMVRYSGKEKEDEK